MRYAACLLCAPLVWAPVHAGEEQDRYEEQAMTRCASHRAERAMRAERGERGSAIRDLEAAFPGKLPKAEPGKNEKEGEAWFELVAGSGDEWRKTDAVAAGLGPMYERWAQRLELGPAPSIKRDEFLRFSKLIIRNAGLMNEEANAKNDNTGDDADKVFRILDTNSDGELTGTELSSGLREDKPQADGNGDGRISKEEYRDYFRRRVEKKGEAMTAAIRANEALMRNLDGRGKRGTGLPDWFATLDSDKDGQISLFEWRKGGKLTALFQEMDLNGDGLLTKEEYTRYLKMKEDKLKQDKREQEP